MADLTWTNETRKLSELIPWPRNPRLIKQDQAKRLSDSLDQFGQVEIIAIGPGNQVYNGHQRLNVWAEQHGPDFKVDVRVSSRELTEKEREKLVVLLHRGAIGEWDFDTLANEFELGDLLEWGFEERDLELDLWHKEPPEDPGPQIDRAEELQEKWQVQRGQVWQVGRHRLMCGDSTCAEDVARLMGGEKAQGAFTSPPYAEQRKDQYGGISIDDYIPWWGSIQSNVRSILQPNGSFFVNIREHAQDGERVLYVFDLVLAMKRRWEWCYIDDFRWIDMGMPGKWPNRFKDAHEPVFHFAMQTNVKLRHQNVAHDTEGWFRYNPDTPSFSDYTGNVGFGTKQPPKEKGKALPSNVVFAHRSPDEARVDGEALRHEAAFPIALPKFFVLAFSDDAEVWYEPFSGSGTTLVACEQTGRIGYGMEIEPKYCAVTLERLTGMGLEARLVEHNS